jgi:hypothetical protein
MPELATDGSSASALLFLLGFLVLSLAFGRRLLRVLGCRDDLGSASERAVTGAGLGAGVLQFVPFALAVAGRFDVTALRIAGAGVALLLSVDGYRVVKTLAAAVRASERPNKWTLVWLLALSPCVVVLFLIALTPSLDPDGLAYHLTVPKRWMHAGSLDYLPTYPYSNTPMGMEMLFAWAMSFAGDAAAKCVHLALGLLATAAIVLAGKRLASPMSGVVPATLFLVGPAGVAVVLGFTYVEGGASLATAGALLAWLIWFQQQDRGFLRAAALLAGLAVSFKISAALFPAALLALTVIAESDPARPRERTAGGVAASVLSCAPLVLLVALPIVPWLARAFLLTGNPLFPLFANIIPSRDLSPELATKVDHYNRYMTWGNSFGRDWPQHVRAKVLLAVAALWALLGAFAFFKLRTRVARGAVVVTVITGLAQLSAAGLYIRYSIPLTAAVMVPMAATLDRQLARRWVATTWIAVTLLFSLMQTRRILVDAGANIGGLVRTAIGLETRRDFLLSRLVLYPLYERANSLPADAGVLLSSSCGGFYIDRDTFCAEMVSDSLRFTSWEVFTADLKKLGITHLVAPSALATGGPTPDLGGSSVSVVTRAGQFQMVRRLLEQHSRTLKTAADFGLYEITAMPVAGR